MLLPSVFQKGGGAPDHQLGKRTARDGLQNPNKLSPHLHLHWNDFFKSLPKAFNCQQQTPGKPDSKSSEHQHLFQKIGTYTATLHPEADN